MTIDRRRLIAGGAALAGGSTLAACDEATRERLQARLNPTRTGGDAPVADRKSVV